MFFVQSWRPCSSWPGKGRSFCSTTGVRATLRTHPAPYHSPDGLGRGLTAGRPGHPPGRCHGLVNMRGCRSGGRNGPSGKGREAGALRPDRGPVPGHGGLGPHGGHEPGGTRERPVPGVVETAQPGAPFPTAVSELPDLYGSRRPSVPGAGNLAPPSARSATRARPAHRARVTPPAN